MRLLGIVSAVLAMSQPVAAKNVVAQDSPGITLAIMQGNAPELERIGKTQSPARLAARAGYYRVRGNIPESTRWADTCVLDPGVVAERSQGVMFLCRSVKAGNRLLLGDIAGWAKDMLQVRSIYVEKVAPSLGPGEEVAGIARPDFERFVSTPESGRREGARVVGARIPVSDDLGVPVARGKISGGLDGKTRDIDSDFIVDTGATRSHLSRKAAQSMGLKVTGGFGMDLTTADKPVSIGLADPVDIELGGMKFRNVSFTVTDSIDFNIIGLDILEQMGPIALKDGYIELIESVPATLCRQPALFTSSLWGGQISVRLPMTIGKANTLVLLDTGTDLSLEAAGVNLASYPKDAMVEKRRFTMHGLETVSYAEATAPVTFNGATATFQTQVSGGPGSVFPVSWRVGYGLRGEYDYYLDVANGRGCLAARTGAPARTTP